MMTEKQAQFREQFRAATPGWYRGELHLGFTLCFTGFVLFFSALHIHGASVAQWLVIVPAFLFGNWAEWAGHRYLLHGRVKGFEAPHKRHVGVHHQFFTDRDLSYHGQKDWRALLFPPFAPILFVVAALPAAVLLGFLWAANVGYIVMLTMAAYYLMYEGLHTLSHIEHPLLDRIPLVNTVRRMHVVHHNLDFMQTRNFNLTFPICDALFGTSDLDRGLLGTLFNGMSNEHVKLEVAERLARRGGDPAPAQSGQ